MEFVSANPTGPLHIGHGRGAAVGDVLANVLEKSGYQVVREYYVNDAGRQIETLGRSVYLRWKELQGESVDYPPDLYQGDYVRDIARMLLDGKSRGARRRRSGRRLHGPVRRRPGARRHKERP